MFALLTTFAEALTYTYTMPAPQHSNGTVFSGLLSIPFLILNLVPLIITLVSMWKIFVKAGERGWRALIPVYNVWILLRIVARPWWWIIFLALPFVSIVAAIILANDIAKAFSQGPGMTVLLVLLPFVGLPLLAFGPYEFQPPVGGGGSMPAAVA
jgi:hypothetical protein